MNTKELDKIKQEMIKEMHENISFMDELKALNVDKITLLNNSGIIYDYYESQKSVLKCVAAGKCLHSNQYHNLRLEVSPPYATIHAEICPAYFAENQAVSRFFFNDFPLHYIKTNVADLPKRRNFAEFHRELLDFMNGGIKTIYASSSLMINKLEVVIPFLKVLTNMNQETTFGVVNFPKLVRELSVDIFNRQAEIEQVLNQLMNLDYLVLDDFGNEEVNKLIRDKITFPLVTGRLLQRKNTIYLSNVTLDELLRLHDYSGKDVRVKQIVTSLKDAIRTEIILFGTGL